MPRPLINVLKLVRSQTIVHISFSTRLRGETNQPGEGGKFERKGEMEIMMKRRRQRRIGKGK